jgi:hypothetical protein
MNEPLSRAQRDALVQRIRTAEDEAYAPPDPKRPQSPLMGARAEDTYLAIQAEYSDRLPRVLMSACPFTGTPLLRVFDPFGLDGPWWHTVRTFDPEEPAPPPSFRALLGALDLHGRTPTEATEGVLAGPGAPFVVPRLLELPDMVAVIHRIEMETGDLAYPVGYFSREDLDKADLHQFWTRQELWFKSGSGDAVWTMKNDAWDFDLAPWIVKGKVRWIVQAGGKTRVAGHGEGETCPYVGLTGTHQRQIIGDGELDLAPPPDGTEPEPFA